MRISVLTLFPEVINSYMSASVLGRALSASLLTCEAVDIRAFTEDKHARTDDYPYGGGTGMVMSAQPIFDAYASVRAKHGPHCLSVYMSPQGRKLDNALARELASREDIIILCGHYEGVDQRAIDSLMDMEISVGDYVLTGGELPALCVIDSLARFIPGVLGNEGGSADESFENGLLEYPQYTRPAVFRGLEVPPVLTGGKHADILRYRAEASLEKTRRSRPELIQGRTRGDYLDALSLRRAAQRDSDDIARLCEEPPQGRETELVAILCGEVVGYICLCPCEGAQGEAHVHVYVRADMPKAHTGAAMLHLAYEWALKAGIHTLNGEGSAPMFAEAGFHRVKCEKGCSRSRVELRGVR